MDTRLTLANICRRIARIGSIIIILLGIPFLLFVGLQIFSGEPASPTIFFSLLTLVGLIAGMVIAWWKEGLGAAITLVSIIGYFFVSGTVPGLGEEHGFPLFVGPVHLLFAVTTPDYNADMSPQARWVPLISWVLTIVPVALFFASWWLRREQPRVAAISGS